MKKVAHFISIALLFLTGFLGIANGIRELSDGVTGLQQSVTFAVLLYGVLGLMGGIGLLRRRPWTWTVVVAWTIATTYAGTVASFAYHDPTFREQGTLTGAIAAFVSILLIDSLVVWTAVWTARSSTRTSVSAAP